MKEGNALKRLSRQSSSSSPDSNQSSKVPPAKRRREGSPSTGSASNNVSKDRQSGGAFSLTLPLSSLSHSRSHLFLTLTPPPPSLSFSLIPNYQVDGSSNLRTSHGQAQPTFSTPQPLAKRPTPAAAKRRDPSSPLSGQRSSDQPLSLSSNSPNTSFSPASGPSQPRCSGSSSSSSHPCSSGSSSLGAYLTSSSSGSSSSALPQSSGTDQSSSSPSPSYEQSGSGGQTSSGGGGGGSGGGGGEGSTVSEESPSISVRQQPPSSPGETAGCSREVPTSSEFCEDDATVEYTMEPSVSVREEEEGEGERRREEEDGGTTVLLNDSIFANILSSEDSDVEIIGTPVERGHADRGYAGNTSPVRRGQDDLGGGGGGDMSPELLQSDYHPPLHSTPPPSPPPPLDSPAKCDSVSGGEGGASEGEDAGGVADSQVSLRLHYSQSQELSFMPTRAATSAGKMEVIVEEGEKEEGKEEAVSGKEEEVEEDKMEAVSEKKEDKMEVVLEGKTTEEEGEKMECDDTTSSRPRRPSSLSSPPLTKGGSPSPRRPSSLSSPPLTKGGSPPRRPSSLSSPPLAALTSPPRRPRLPLSSPVTSADYVSPSRSISAEGLLELRRQVAERTGREAELCELRYVRTVCTVIEERFISSELVENGVVVPGSGKCWPVSL